MPRQAEPGPHGRPGQCRDRALQRTGWLKRPPGTAQWLLAPKIAAEVVVAPAVASAVVAVALVVVPVAALLLLLLLVVALLLRLLVCLWRWSGNDREGWLMVGGRMAKGGLKPQVGDSTPQVG